ncbi:hypothetical protein GGI43DRAFT_388810 [Trichoderma evansii]
MGWNFYERSTLTNSFAICTHNQDTLKFYSNFTAQNFPFANGHNIGKIGARAIEQDVHLSFKSRGMDIIGGYEQSVSLVSGFGQGGDVGSFTTTYGLMANNAVEVTAVGEVHTSKQYNGPEIVAKTPVAEIDLDQSTSVHPAWRRAPYYVIHVEEWLEVMSYYGLKHNINRLLKLLDPLKKLSPDAGAYFIL